MSTRRVVDRARRGWVAGLRHGRLVAVAVSAVVMYAPKTTHAQPAQPAPPQPAQPQPANAPAASTRSSATLDPPLAKKDRAAQAKSTRHPPPPVPGRKPKKLINLYNYWTKEWLAVDATTLPAQDTVDRFLRDRFTNLPTAMAPRLIPTVVAAANRFGSDIVQIVSGFRHPKYNLILRKKGHQVARDSHHTHGTAIDFFLPRVPATTLEAWAKAQRLGGVGLYPESGFVHIDTGPIRSWSGE